MFFVNTYISFFSYDRIIIHRYKTDGDKGEYNHMNLSYINDCGCRKLLTDFKFRVVDQNKQAVEGAEFTLYKKDQRYPYRTMISDLDGNVIFKGVARGNYIMKQTIMPGGFEAWDGCYEVCITSHHVYVNGHCGGLTIIHRQLNDEHNYTGIFDFEVLKLLAGAAVAQFIGAGGSAIFSYLFNNQKTNPFDEQAYREIARIVREEITTAQIAYVNGELEGIIKYVAVVHNIEKEAGASRLRLYNDLKPHYDKLFHLIGVLMREYYSKAGFPVFLICAYQTILLSQELAAIDPEFTTRPSPYLTTVKLLADDFLIYAEKIMPQIIKDRENQFSTSEKMYPGIGGGYWIISWKDAHTGAHKEWLTQTEYQQTKAACKASMEAAKLKAVNELKSSLRYDEFINNMKTLKINPAPFLN